MNARLKNVKDGLGNMGRNEVVWFDVCVGPVGSGVTRQESGEIYWPFALVWNCTRASDNCFDVVHLPSGYYVVNHGIPRRRALALVKKLRAADVDWAFTKPKGRKWDAVQRACRALVMKERKSVNAESAQES